MPSTNDFVTHILDLLGGLGDATSRAMFGAHGIYVGGMIVGLVEDDTLYLKVDDQNRGRFEGAGGTPFTYHDKAGQPRTMAYWTVPDHLLDDAGAMVEWGRTSLEAAMRAKTPGRKTTGKAAAKRTAPAAAPAKAAAKRNAPAAVPAKAAAKRTASAAAPAKTAAKRTASAAAPGKTAAKRTASTAAPTKTAAKRSAPAAKTSNAPAKVTAKRTATAAKTTRASKPKRSP